MSDKRIALVNVTKHATKIIVGVKMTRQAALKSVSANVIRRYNPRWQLGPAEYQKQVMDYFHFSKSTRIR